MGTVVCVLPRAGLGNKLLVWARAHTFARLNALPCRTFGWTYPQIGPLLRGERRQVRYGANFKSDAGGVVAALGSLVFARTRCFEPEISLVRGRVRRGDVFVFRRVPHYRDYFEGIREAREPLRKLLLETVKPELVRRVYGLRAPVIGVHVRCGDFRRLRAGEDFSKVGLVRTPEEYFLERILELRNCAGRPLQVMVFSDGTERELEFLTRLPNVERAPRLPDIGDVLLMARAKILVTSAGSTFGMWAGFLSDSALIVHGDHMHASIRPAETNAKFFEGSASGPWQGWNELLIANVKKVGRETAD